MMGYDCTVLVYRHPQRPLIPPAVENATNVAGSDPDWGKIVEFCNRVQNSVGPSAMKGALLAIVKRINHQEERVQMQALAVSVCAVPLHTGIASLLHFLLCVSVCLRAQLLESCVSNCGKSFRAEMSDSQVLADLGEVAKGVSQHLLHGTYCVHCSWSHDCHMLLLSRVATAVLCQAVCVASLPAGWQNLVMSQALLLSVSSRTA